MSPGKEQRDTLSRAKVRLYPAGEGGPLSPGKECVGKASFQHLLWELFPSLCHFSILQHDFYSIYLVPGTYPKFDPHDNPTMTVSGEGTEAT